MRTSRPFTEAFCGIPYVDVGTRVERDDGWWRVVRINCLCKWPDAAILHERYWTEMDWVPI